MFFGHTEEKSNNAGSTQNKFNPFPFGGRLGWGQQNCKPTAIRTIELKKEISLQQQPLLLG